ncbi:MAG: hypothetical protein QW734_04420 [Candidatus Bathyarchaeia archaeon]
MQDQTREEILREVGEEIRGAAGKEVRRRTKVVEMFCGEGLLVKLFVLGAQPLERAPGRTLGTELYRSRKLPCSPEKLKLGTMHFLDLLTGFALHGGPSPLFLVLLKRVSMILHEHKFLTHKLSAIKLNHFMARKNRLPISI